LREDGVVRDETALVFVQAEDFIVAVSIKNVALGRRLRIVVAMGPGPEGVPLRGEAVG
jgi:hypothetical protein